MEHQMSNFTATAIERIATGSVIYVRGGFNAAAEVLDIDFDTDQYIITYGTDDAQFTTTVMAGETVEAFNGQTFLRADKDISVEEHEAKFAADQAATKAMLAKLPSIHAETAAMQAEMFGAPALVAAE
jgi:hypothetical protein